MTEREREFAELVADLVVRRLDQRAAERNGAAFAQREEGLGVDEDLAAANPLGVELLRSCEEKLRRQRERRTTKLGKRR